MDVELSLFVSMPFITGIPTLGLLRIPRYFSFKQMDTNRWEGPMFTSRGDITRSPINTDVCTTTTTFHFDDGI